VHTDEDYPGARGRGKARAAQIDNAIANGGLADHISRILVAAWFLLAVPGVAATTFAVLGTGPVQLATSDSTPAKIISFTANAGTYMISLFALLLVVLGIQTYRNPQVRRTVGVIWDLPPSGSRAASAGSTLLRRASRA
jgi:hypothetical protein